MHEKYIQMHWPGIFLPVIYNLSYKNVNKSIKETISNTGLFTYDHCRKVYRKILFLSAAMPLRNQECDSFAILQEKTGTV